MACGILVPGPEIEPRAPAVKTQSPNHWTARAALCSVILKKSCSVSEGFTLSKSPNLALPQFGEILFFLFFFFFEKYFSKLICPVLAKLKKFFF